MPTVPARLRIAMKIITHCSERAFGADDNDLPSTGV